jgi:hypothetical protein
MTYILLVSSFSLSLWDPFPSISTTGCLPPYSARGERAHSPSLSYEVRGIEAECGLLISGSRSRLVAKGEGRDNVPE